MPKLRRELRKILNDTVSDLGAQVRVAELMNVDQATVSRWMSGSQGMDISACLRFAKLTNTPLTDVLTWAGYDAAEYLPDAKSLPSLPADAKEIADRARLMTWEKRRAALPERVRPMFDRAVEAILRSHEDAWIPRYPADEPPETPRPRGGRPRKVTN